jgi:MarR family transcriptional regulator, organic hydroperoxide resistance regulator
MHDLSRYPEPIRAVLAAQFEVVRHALSPRIQDWAHLGLSMGQLKALMMLAAQGDMTVTHVAELLYTGKPAASIVVDRLVQLGMAQRTEDAQDRRRTLVTLTDAGRDLATRLHQGGIDRFAQLLEAMEPDDLAALQRGMEALAAIAASTPNDCSQTPHDRGTTNGTVHHSE